ncbi:MAG: DUF58 domain-containing protein [Myxococcota bacterium]
MIGFPVPTTRAVALLGAGLFPAVLGAVDLSFAYLALTIDVAVVFLCLTDYLRAKSFAAVSVRRVVEPVLSSGKPNVVRIEIEPSTPLGLNGSDARARSPFILRGELRDEVAPGPTLNGHRQRFELTRERPCTTLTYFLTPPSRGDLAFGDLHLRLWGPLGLCARQYKVLAKTVVKVYPDLTALSREALTLSRTTDAPSDRTRRRPSEGRELESLREYRQGDDYRTIDWKASAKRARPMVRVYQPERNQPVMLLLDCGRHMAGIVGGRRKLDHAVDAALRLAKVSLDKGDLVGVLAFATQVRAFLPPRKGREHLRALTEALYRAEAALEESDYGGALDVAFARHHKRTLVALFTDLVDPDTSAALVARTLRLRPRHLPLVVSLLDEDLERAATDEPATVQSAYERQAAARLEGEYRLTAARLRNQGSVVVRAPARTFCATAVNEYLRIKAHGLL